MRLLPIVVCLLAAAAGAFASGQRAVVPEGQSGSGPFSPGIQAGGILYCSGQVGRDKTGKIPENFEDEVKAALDNAGAILKTAGYSLTDAVSVQVYLTDMELFQRMNAVYVTYFPEPRPARTTVGVTKLVGTARIEITVTAWKNPAK